jgi:Cdc6-like AAA superfamily ATPase
LLRAAGESADARGSAVVELEDVERAEKLLEIERASRAIMDLPLQEVLVIEALCWAADEVRRKLKDEGKEPAENPPVSAEVLFRRYKEEASFFETAPKGRRRFLDFLQDLQMHGLIGSLNESSGRYGRQKLVWIEGDPVRIKTQAFAYMAHRCRPDLVQKYGIRPPHDD